MMRTLAILILVSPAVHAQAAKNPPKAAASDQIRVDQAIKKGVDFLKTAPSPGQGKGGNNADDLLLLTFIHAGVPETDPKFQELLANVLAAPLETTYKVALQAMALEELDRVKFQKRIFHCAQFLVDNQAPSGQWGYGESTVLPDYPAGTPTTGAKKPTATSSKTPKKGSAATAPARTKPAVVQKVPVKKQRDGSAHDNSNSQYAALGLRACHEAGIILPQEVIEKAVDWWRKSQEAGRSKGNSGAVATGGALPSEPPRGWGYDRSNPFGSMTAGAVGALAIYDVILGNDWRKDPNLQAGISWLSERFTVTENPGAGGEQAKWHYYYLYALERVGMLCDTEMIGQHAWYSIGLKYLLDAQKPDGSWSGDKSKPTWDTCFAILFLKRATRSLRDVPSIDRYHPK